MRRIKCTVFVLLFCLLLNLAGCAAAQKPTLCAQNTD